MLTTHYFSLMESYSPVFLIIEDHPEVAHNNCLFLEQLNPEATCTIATTHPAALERLSLEPVALAVVDLLVGTLTGEQSAHNGIAFLEQVLVDYPSLNILIYTSEYSYLRPLSQRISHHQGGFVVVSKLERRKAFLEGVQQALDGKLSLPRELRQDFVLTERELEVLRLLCQNSMKDKAIAQEMNLSLKTIQNCVQHLKVKLDIDYLDDQTTSPRVALCMEAIRRRLLML
ncbi:response regulator transcription factor [Lyngbya confervoides]|uniref:Response regulator transcription factor n=1 Tax=Lyngbya confervoides BDU141951 TaxID=1574623 RepID=A0ABD4T7K0_9CYAN|nr:response regulator transcription factor [Lyngbya confervoides]MCM1984494.1 response regulator transcription factor [Lyngbya confervoides BDU141951]